MGVKNTILRNIALRIAYQGQCFAGWQCQPRERTVEAELRQALYKMHKHEVVLYAAGRTDAGVHATGQVANFHSDIRAESLPAGRFREALNSRLSKDIRILQSWQVPPDFHARHSARARVYHYRIVQGPGCTPEQRQQAWYVRTPELDLAVLNCMLSPLLGEHDFSAFTVAGDQARSKVRRLYAASFYCEGPYLLLRIVGNAFLWHMVRSIIGTAVGLYRHYYQQLEEQTVSAGLWRNLHAEVYAQRHALREQLARRLAGEDLIGGHTGFKAPAHGLSLSQVLYPGPDGRPWQWQL